MKSKNNKSVKQNWKPWQTYTWSPLPPPHWTCQTWHSPLAPPPPPTQDPNIAINTAAFGVRMPPSCWCLSIEAQLNDPVCECEAIVFPLSHQSAVWPTHGRPQTHFISHAGGPTPTGGLLSGRSWRCTCGGHVRSWDLWWKPHGCRCIYIIFYP